MSMLNYEGFRDTPQFCFVLQFALFILSRKLMSLEVKDSRSKQSNENSFDLGNNLEKSIKFIQIPTMNI